MLSRHENWTPIFSDGVLTPSEAGIAAFWSRFPFPWRQYDDIVTAEFYSRLIEEFPETGWFERHEAIPRGYQRPHNRLYLAYESTRYPPSGARGAGPGVIGRGGLKSSWRRFVDELRRPPFGRLAAGLFGCDSLRLRFAWHRSHAGSEVSPHTDSSEKLGTFIFYFNTPRDWSCSYGGATSMLGDLSPGVRRPDFSDFNYETQVHPLDAQCVVFRRTENSWHGVRPLTCPEGCHRKTFHVIAEAGRGGSISAG